MDFYLIFNIYSKTQKNAQSDIGKLWAITGSFEPCAN